MNFISGSAKLDIWLMRRNLAQNTVSMELVPVLRGLLKARLRVEHGFFQTIDNMKHFMHIWATGVILCSVGEGGELIFIFLIRKTLLCVWASVFGQFFWGVMIFE